MRIVPVFVLLFAVQRLVAPAGALADSGGWEEREEVVRSSSQLERADARTLRSTRHLVHDIDPESRAGYVNAVIEIPAGTTQKWEVEKASGNLVWELRKGKPRQVKYLGYPGNYGMIPRTLLAEEHGGDGDPLDVLVLGPTVPRGEILNVRIIGILKMLDKGEQDDKLIAVPRAGAFRKIDSVEELDRKRPGVSDIIRTWFAYYKGPDKIEIQGFSGPEDAQAVLLRALDDYGARQNKTDSGPVED